ncbi:MAG: hypothetical protein IKB38_04100 [Clostridia bacterium]|nr:hypothetical protein [Clostridia bacterium]
MLLDSKSKQRLSRVQAPIVRKELSQNNFLNFALKTKKVLENQGLSAGVVKLTSKDVIARQNYNSQIESIVLICGF